MTWTVTRMLGICGGNCELQKVSPPHCEDGLPTLGECIIKVISPILVPYKVRLDFISNSREI